MRLSLPTRIFLGFALTLSCFAVASLYGIAAVTGLRHELSLLRQRALPLLSTLRDNALELRGFDEALARAAPHDLDWVARFAPTARPFERLDGILVQIGSMQAVEPAPRLAEALLPSSEPLPAIGSSLVASRTTREGAQRIGADAALLALLPGAGTPTDDAAAFTRLVDGLQRAVGEKRYGDASRLVVEMRRIVRRVHGAIGRAEAQFDAALQDRFAVAERSEAGLMVAVLASTGLALLISVLVLLAMIVSLRPMAQLAEVVRRFGAGERKARALPRGAPELQALAREMNRMAEALEAREHQALAAREELARAERLAALGQLAAQMAHEIRNPLSSIGLNAELLGDELRALQAREEAGAGHEAAELIAAIGAEIERLRAITERYLARARAPEGAHELIDLGLLVGQVLDFAQAELDQRGVRLRVDAAPGIELRGDEGQLRQALWNLLRNAWEAMPAGGELLVELRAATGARGEDAVLLAVEDDGPGVDEAARERVFEAFFSTKERGTGVGLAVVREAARAHGGVARAAAARRLRGARFELTLPRGGGRQPPA
jgi:signal transduction histidine kinase